MSRLPFAVFSLVMLVASPLAAQEPYRVSQASVLAHETFLASDALRGRGSATHDEAVAATYVAAMFQSYGLVPAPGMNGYLQTAPVTRTMPGGAASLAIGDIYLTQGEDMAVLLSSGRSSSGTLAVAIGTNPADLPTSNVVMIAPAEGRAGLALLNAAATNDSNVIIIRQTDFLRDIANNARPSPSWKLTGATPRVYQVDAVLLTPETYDRVAVQAGAPVTFDTGAMGVTEVSATTAIGYLPGTDPRAGVLMISAHLDHLGMRPDGVIMPGANDDASGTTAVLELAKALSTGAPMRRGVLFAAFGAEEIGGLGSQYFAEHPPVPLDTIVAGIGFEMIGNQDPQMPPGVLIMTGYDRSNFARLLKDNGAPIVPDPYLDQNFFERSDNYSLALKGVVAHTVAASGLIATYHSPEDTVASLDIPFLTRTIQSFVEPLRAVANGDDRPQWNDGGKPEAN